MDAHAEAGDDAAAGAAAARYLADFPDGPHEGRARAIRASLPGRAEGAGEGDAP
ncbi:MAG: hypothetical protein AAF447_16775 [Myxococcota bacterium]